MTIFDSSNIRDEYKNNGHVNNYSRDESGQWTIHHRVEQMLDIDIFMKASLFYMLR